MQTGSIAKMDREKVIKAYECCKNSYDRICEKCPYEKDCCHDGIPMFVIKKMVELLKEQEAKPPAIMQDVEGIWSTCSTCGHKLRPILAMKKDTYFPKFCAECGQKVKWE